MHVNDPVCLHQAWTPPASWYTSALVHEREVEQVFSQKWVCVGHLGALQQQPGAYMAGDHLGMPYVITRAADGALRAFHNVRRCCVLHAASSVRLHASWVKILAICNTKAACGQVCRHHAAAVASGCGVAECLVCPYHGWVYGLDGRLRKAPDMRGAQDFQASAFSLAPLRLETWGHLIFLNFGAAGAARQHAEPGLPGSDDLAQQMGPRGKAAMEAAGMTDAGLVHVASRQYRLRCNWKVFVDNYLVGQHPAGPSVYSARILAPIGPCKRLD